MRQILATLALAAAISLAPGVAHAATNPSGSGQPNASCEETPATPGRSAGAPGSAFNPDGTAGTVYAGEQPQNSNNPSAVSQYDVACFQNSQH